MHLVLNKCERVDSKDISADDEKVVFTDAVIDVRLWHEGLTFKACIELCTLLLWLASIFMTKHKLDGLADWNLAVAFGIPVIEQGRKVFLTEDSFAVESQKHELDLVEVAIFHDVDLFKNLSKLLECDLSLN